MHLKATTASEFQRDVLALRLWLTEVIFPAAGDEVGLPLWVGCSALIWQGGIFIVNIYWEGKIRFVCIWKQVMVKGIPEVEEN